MALADLDSAIPCLRYDNQDENGYDNLGFEYRRAELFLCYSACFCRGLRLRL
jgi:hypothetical protein